MDAFPGYTYFNPTRKVLCAMQIVKDTTAVSTSAFDTVFPHEHDEDIEEAEHDSVSGASAMDPDVSTDLGGKNAKDLVEGEAFIADNGNVTATLKKIEDWTAFGTINNSGYFFPVQIDVPEAKYMNFYKTTKANENYPTEPTKKEIAYDSKIIVRVFDGAKTQTIFDFKIETLDKDKKLLTTDELHFTGITFDDSTAG